MMKTKIAVAALLASTAMASAADLGARPYTKAPAAASVYNWTGFYVGGQVGASSANTRFQDRDDYFDNEGMNPERKVGFTGGVYGGYNWQITPSFLVGLDAQWSWYDQKVTGYPDYTDAYIRTDIRDAGNVKLRFGLVFNDTMVYVAAGPAWANTTFRAVDDGLQIFSNSKYVGGYAAAVGVEHMLTQNWILKGQFQYAAFNTQHAQTVDLDRFGQTTDLMEATIGLSYKFGPTY
jgi:outer membrane immunogenic protein